MGDTLGRAIIKEAMPRAVVVPIHERNVIWVVCAAQRDRTPMMSGYLSPHRSFHHSSFRLHLHANVNKHAVFVYKEQGRRGWLGDIFRLGEDVQQRAPSLEMLEAGLAYLFVDAQQRWRTYIGDSAFLCTRLREGLQRPHL